MSSLNRRKTTHKWGITPPLSVCLPTDEERAQTLVLRRFLKTKAGVYESEEEMTLRRAILQEIYDLTCEWVKSIVGKRGKCCLFTFGSYRLGVGGPGADIDALVVAPQAVSRDRFFDDWEKILHERKEYVSKAVIVRESFVPVIKCVWRDVDIDLLFCALEESAIVHSLNPASADDRVLECVQDETSVRSLNGVRVTDRILQLVPSVPTFRTVLRFVKNWAKKRAIYSNSIGYLGGVAWAILVARICQLYPLSSAFTVLKHFYTIMAHWQWPNPVMLSPPSKASETLNNGAALSMPQWDSTSNYRDRQHLMPILTPAFPAQNCTYNVSQSTFDIMKRELTRAETVVTRFSIVPACVDSKAQSEDEDENARKRRKTQSPPISVDGLLELLCDPTTFFSDFKTFLCVEAFVDRPAVHTSLSARSSQPSVDSPSSPSPTAKRKEKKKCQEEHTPWLFEEPLLGHNNNNITDVSRSTTSSPSSTSTLPSIVAENARVDELSSRLYDFDEFSIAHAVGSNEDTPNESVLGDTILCAAAAKAADTTDLLPTEDVIDALTDYERDAWFGWVESRLRFLTAGLEQTRHIDRVCPFPRAYKSAEREGNSELPRSRSTCCYFFGLKFAIKTLVVGQKTQVDVTAAVNQFLNRIYAQQKSVLAGCTVKTVKRKDLPEWVRQD